MSDAEDMNAKSVEIAFGRKKRCQSTEFQKIDTIYGGEILEVGLTERRKVVKYTWWNSSLHPFPTSFFRDSGKDHGCPGGAKIPGYMPM